MSPLQPLLFFLALPLAAQETPFATVLAEVEKFRGEEGLKNASLGFALLPLDAADPSAVVGYQADAALLPASTLKVVTTATALDLLDPAFRFTTTLQHTGAIGTNGVLRGDLVIKGGGDPTLGEDGIPATFARWQAALRAKGITRIAGRVIGDDILFGTQLRPDSWQWNDLGNYYAAGASGLNIHRNLFLCRFRTGPAGSAAEFLGTDPELPGITVVNEMRVGPVGSGDQGYVYGAPYNTLLYLRGSVPPGGEEFAIRGALPDPALFCAQAFNSHLASQNIRVSGTPSTARLLSIVGEAIGGRHDLLETTSAPLPALIQITNFVSDNLYAECLHRMIGVEHSGDGATAAASKVIGAHWNSQGVDLTGFNMADGCGLSRANTITARQMTHLLSLAAKSEHSATFLDSLPVAGVSGTLRHIGAGSPAAGKVRAKNGSIERVMTYCGYIDSRSGRRFAFALFINHYTGSSDPLKAGIVRIWNQVVAL